MFGTFYEREGDAHIEMRETQLRRASWLPSPAFLKPPYLQAEHLLEQINPIIRVLKDSGLAIVNLDRLLTNDEFISLGNELGIPIPETSPKVRTYVEDELILNLVQKEVETSDVDVQPFAENYLTLHTESSTKMITEQPRYIVLMCINAPRLNSGGQTILVPMRRVYEKLSKGQIAILSSTRYERHIEGPPFFSWQDDRPIFSFRDLSNQALDWCYEGADPEISNLTINDAIRALLVAMYEPTFPFGIHWSRSTLVILDNTFYFHGKTFGQITEHQSLRHLKRLRILSRY